MKKTNKYQNLGLCLGLGFGLAFGSAVFDNTGIGMCIGLALGLALGAAKDKQINEQMERKGYAVKTIAPREDGSAAVTIVDRAGGEQTLDVPRGTMETERFRVGDSVYLDDEGALEKAYDEEAGE